MGSLRCRLLEGSTGSAPHTVQGQKSQETSCDKTLTTLNYNLKL